MSGPHTGSSSSSSNSSNSKRDGRARGAQMSPVRMLGREQGMGMETTIAAGRQVRQGQQQQLQQCLLAEGTLACSSYRRNKGSSCHLHHHYHQQQQQQLYCSLVSVVIGNSSNSVQ